MTNLELANLIFPEIRETIEDLEKRYPQRNLKEGAEVTRFAPSPTGFLHTGSLFTSLICRKVASQTNGIFYIRLEDTDTKREIEGSGKQLLEQLNIFNVKPDEGYLGDEQKGDYGPYIQSQRADIYRVVIKDLLIKGLAYPCFCSPNDLESIRKDQESKKLNPGYYGEFARCRDLNNDERAKRIKNGDNYVIRFRSNGNHLNKIKVHDLVHGDFEIAENDQDIVIYKSDGLPTYHFAHVVDDHFMRTTTVIRGEEWISSLPIHIELFNTLGFQLPNYAHLPVIMKLDENGHKRKLSKRLDSEAAVSYFIQDGYPVESLPMYLMTIANSNFEAYILENKFEKMDAFNFSFNKMSLDGALFDIGKLNFFAREILGKKTKDEMTALAMEYAIKNNEELYNIITANPQYFTAIMNIDREKENPRKDYEKFADVLNVIAFFYKDKYEKLVADNGLPFNEKFDKAFIASVLEKLKVLDLSLDEQSWFNNLKSIAVSLSFAENNKMFKSNPELYKGTVGDVAEMLRITLTSRKNSPNLYAIMQILGKEESVRRINYIISLLNK